MAGVLAIIKHRIGKGGVKVRKEVSVQTVTYRYPAIARLTKAARRFGNLGSFSVRGRSQHQPTHVSCAPHHGPGPP